MEIYTTQFSDSANKEKIVLSSSVFDLCAESL